MYAVMDDRDKFFGTFKTRAEAEAKARSLAAEFKGVQFHVYTSIWMVCVPSDVQKADKDFWR
jgi:hypothetical protein